LPAVLDRKPLLVERCRPTAQLIAANSDHLLGERSSRLVYGDRGKVRGTKSTFGIDSPPPTESLHAIGRRHRGDFHIALRSVTRDARSRRL
jgi:hypothetical protein